MFTAQDIKAIDVCLGMGGRGWGGGGGDADGGVRSFVRSFAGLSQVGALQRVGVALSLSPVLSLSTLCCLLWHPGQRDGETENKLVHFSAFWEEGGEGGTDWEQRSHGASRAASAGALVPR